MNYPVVRSEEETLRAVLGGYSIARYGDGEFKLAGGGHCVSQVWNKSIGKELREILASRGGGRCLVGIPNLDVRSPKIQNWRRYEQIYPRFLHPKATYYSAFISRPDSAPWIYTREFYALIESLWSGQEIAMVYGTDRSLSADFPAMKSAANIHVVSCARRDAYEQIDSLVAEVIRTGAKRAILCCGPTATCMAWRLAPMGVHAIDLGHIGMFWYREGETPKWMRSASEKN